MSRKNLGVAALLALSLATSIQAQDAITMEVNAKKPVASINPDMYGVFFEDINFGADGGLYAELIKNRSFEFTNSPLMGWLSYGNVKILTDKPAFDRNPHYARISYNGELLGAGLINEGFRGIGVKKDEEYNFSFYARTNTPADFVIELLDGTGARRQEIKMKVTSSDWEKAKVKITPNFTDTHAKVRINLVSKGSTVDIDHISLFPQKTFKGRENGLREDLAQALADLKPGVFRFPGGCIVEGNTLKTRYQWKNSVGPVENRPINDNRWNYEFQHRFHPDYFQSYGLGFFEYFQLAEDIGAAPLPVLSVGLACQYASTELVPLNELDPYIQDALDLIEFANGDVSTKWGKLRAEMGHPAPFNLKYLAIGNEQWDTVYPERLELFNKAIRKQYPSIEIVGSSGPVAGGDGFNYLWKEMTRLKVDLVDEHYYCPPDWFFKNAARYDNYDRKGPKVFAGEYASHTREKRNNWLSALSEAAFMTGLERNADMVRLATYAPLFAHVDAWQWAPDMIWFDNLNMYKTPNYFVQQMYAHNAGTDVLALTWDKKAVSGKDSLYASAALDKNTNEVILKVANANPEKRSVKFDIKGVNKLQPNGKWTIMTGKLTDENNLQSPTNIVPRERLLTDVSGSSFEVTFDGNSFNIIRIGK